MKNIFSDAFYDSSKTFILKHNKDSNIKGKKSQADFIYKLKAKNVNKPLGNVAIS